MIFESRTTMKIIIFLIINAAMFLGQSEAAKKKSAPKGPSAAPLIAEELIDEEAVPEEYSPQYLKFLKSCEKRMTEKCADEILGGIFNNSKVSKNCCKKLVSMGPDCHKELIKREKGLLKNTNPAETRRILSKSEDFWKKCEKITPPSSQDKKNYPRLPPRELLPGFEEFLEGCARNITERCGNQVVNVIFDKSTIVQKSCCRKLLHVGKDCHDELVKSLMNLDGHFKHNREVKAKSDKIWKDCEKVTRRDEKIHD